MPTFNRGYLIDEAVESVLAQDFADWELVVVDDGSTDDTAAVVGPYLNGSRVSYIRKEHTGAAHSRNVGVSSSNGEYVTFLDSDDVAEAHWLSSLYRALEGGFSVACCSVRRLTPDKEEIQVPESKGPAFHDLVMKFTHGGSYLLERGIFDAVGGFDERVRAGQHTELGIRVAEYCFSRSVRIQNISEPLITVRHTRRDHIRTNDENVYSGAKYFIEKHRDKLEKDKRLLGNYLSVIIERGRKRPFGEIVPVYFQLVRARPLHWRSYARVARDSMRRLLRWSG